MVSVSLLHRLELDSANSATTLAMDDSAVLRSILRNLQMIFNSRKGCCEARPDFGLSDFNTTGDYRTTLSSISKDVERQIRAFETRLRQVSVKPIDDDLSLTEFRFQVDAELADENRTVKVRFDSLFSSDGRIRFCG